LNSNTFLKNCFSMPRSIEHLLALAMCILPLFERVQQGSFATYRF
jgi:hypothetical protein